MRGHSNLFQYTSGRWLYNEPQRLKERERIFNVRELQRLAAEAVSRELEDVVHFEKIGEGAANRAFIVQMRDGFRLVARIPYLVTAPRQLAVASEAATMAFLHSEGIRVPQIYGYSTSADNPAGTEYIFMEFSPGKSLSSLWFAMAEQDRLKFVNNLVDAEARLFNIRLPASGSLYFLPDSFYIGPSTSLHLWYGRRNSLHVDRGPFFSTEAVLTAGARKEVNYLENFGRPLHPFDRIRRETFNLEKQLPSIHLDSLEKYLRVADYLIPNSNRELLQPTIRHPDLRPSNIFVSDDLEITSLIDWQYSTSLPLFLISGIPDDLDNSQDPVSRSLERPRLPDNIQDLEEDEKAAQLEILRARQLHYFYIMQTAEKNPRHLEALNYPFSIGRRKLYQLSGDPWQGDNIPFRSSLIFVKQHWSEISSSPHIDCPMTFTDDEILECLRLDEAEREAEEQMQASKEMLGIGPEGWVSCDHYPAAKEATLQMKADCLEQAESELDRIAIRDHWVYDDIDEDEYL